MPLLRKSRNGSFSSQAHSQSQAQSQEQDPPSPSSPLLSSSTFATSPPTSPTSPRPPRERNPASYKAPAPTSPTSPLPPIPASPSSPTRSPTSRTTSTPRSTFSFPSTPATNYNDTSQGGFQATLPSAYISPHHPQHQYQNQYQNQNQYVGGTRYNEMFDPFSQAPRPKRKPYSPFSAFEARNQGPTPGSAEGQGEEGRQVEIREGGERTTSITSIGSAYSYDAESTQSQSPVQAQGGKTHRRSALSFEIGGGASHEQGQGQGRPSTGDSNSNSSPSSHSHSHSHEPSVLAVPEPTAAEVEEERDSLDLAPPRPRFLRDGGNNAGERGSWSSQDSSTSLYPSAPNSDTEFIPGAESDREPGREREREREVRNDNATRGQGQQANLAGRGSGAQTAATTTTTRGNSGRTRANTGGSSTANPNAYKRRSGSYTTNSGSVSMSNLPPGAAPPAYMQGQGQGRGGAPPTAHRRSSSFTNPAGTTAAAAAASGLAPGEIEEVPVARSESPAQGQGTGVGNGTGARPRGPAPPSAYRGSRASFSGPQAGAGAGAGVGVGVPGAGVQGGVGVPEDAHPLSPNASSYNSPSEDAQWNGYLNPNGEVTSSVGHASFVSSSSYPGGPGPISPGGAAGMYAHQYPHGGLGLGYQYPPSPPPGSGMGQDAYTNGAQGAGQVQVQGQGQGQGGPVYPGGAAYPGGGAGYPYNNLPPNNNQGNGASGYATPTPRSPPGLPPTHNAFFANSAIARSSMSASASGSAVDLVPYAARFNGIAPAPVGMGMHSRRESVDVGGFAPPQPPFAQSNGYGYAPPSPRMPGTPELRHQGSYPRLREPFLSPASRRSSSVWAPPTPAAYTGYDAEGRGSGFFGGYAYNGVGSGSNTMLALPGKKEPFPSSALQRKISVSEKPWIKRREKGERTSWWLTFCVTMLGIAIGGAVIFFGYKNVEKIKNNLCSVLDDDFSSFDTNTWSKNVSLGGFGNGEFQMATDSSENLYIKNGQLYIMPTLTSDEIGTSSIFDGYTYNLTGCTETWNASACNVRSNQATNTVVNPVKSARISTMNSASIAYGKIEVVAKMPKGDWLWPAIWMLPKDEKYGSWPRSGEIDIVEARGNLPTYPEQGNNYVRSSLNWGPLDSVIAFTFGWQSQKRSTYAAGFHTYTLEWTPDFMRISVDSVLRAMLDLNIKKKSFWNRGNFPTTAQNGSTEAVVQNIWEGQPNAAPFDQDFYLIIDLAVGGTSGWFPDNKGGKMWYDGSATAMTDFAKAQDTWYSTWPSSDDERALRVDSVKMWKLC